MTERSVVIIGANRGIGLGIIRKKANNETELGTMFEKLTIL